MPLKSTRVKNNRGAKENICITPISKTQVTTGLAGCRPKRICRLPSKFEDHSTSPSKFIPLQPIQASTPKVQSKGLTVPTNKTEFTVKSKHKADTNNNAKDSTPGKHLCKKSPCKNLNNKVSKCRLINKEYSFKVVHLNFEFGQLPIKWQANTYVKPNMTPAFESSFLVLGDKKKHVYTNIVHEENENLPQIVESDNTPTLRQTSIISFIKEVAEKNAKKKLQSTPVKRNTIFEEIQNISHNLDITPKKQITTRSARKSVTPIKNKSSGNITSSTENISVSDKENSVKKNKKDKDITYFGFDETEEIDQENIIPNNKLDIQLKRALRPRSRAILQELNRKGPPAIPLSVTRNVNKNEKKNLNDIWKDLTGKDVQSSPEKVNHINSKTVNKINDVVITNENNLTQDDSQSVHLFEDLEVVHRVKPPRKSYVKQKRVAFRQNSASSDSQDSDVAEKDESCAVEDDLHDLTFQVQSMEPKKTRTKKRSKKVLSKKEEKEVEAWAAGFNSMCEDVDEFDLVIE